MTADANPSSDSNEQHLAPTKFWMPALRYLLSPKILIGGILAFLITEGVDAYKEHRTESRADFIECRAQVLKRIDPLPQMSADTAKVIASVNALYSVYEADEARQLIRKAIGELSDLKSRQLSEETAVANAAKAQKALIDAIAAEIKEEADLSSAIGEASKVAEAKAKAAQAHEEQQAAEVKADHAKVLSAQSQAVNNLRRVFGVRF
jgi:hypothetical protein